MDQSVETRRGNGWPLRLVVVAAFAVGTALPWACRDYVTASVVAVVAFGALSGYGVGATRTMGSLGGIAAAVAFAPPFARFIEEAIRRWSKTHDAPSHLLLVVFAAIAIFLFVSLTACLVSSWFIRPRRWLQTGDRCVGLLLSAAGGASGAWVLLGGILVAEPLAKARVNADLPLRENALSRAVAQHVVEIAQRTRSSAVGPWVAEWNPFDRLPPLQRFRRTIAALADPQSSPGELPDPLARDVMLQQVLKLLPGDPRLDAILASGQIHIPQSGPPSSSARPGYSAGEVSRGADPKSSQPADAMRTLLNDPAIRDLLGKSR